MPTANVRRGSCPRCSGRSVRHYVPGLPDFESLVDASGDVPPWIHLTGCVIDPGPPFNRECEDCGLRWTASTGARSVVSTWRELRDRIGVATNDDANDWLERQVRASTMIAPFPGLDDPEGELHVRHGATHRSLRFPFTYAEWESILIDLFEESWQPLRDGLGEATDLSPT